MRIASLAAAALVAMAAPAAAQQPFADAGPYDPAVPSPAQVLGYEPGARFTPHHLVMRYLERVAAATPRVRLDTLGRTFEGREIVMAVVTSEANQRRMSEIRANLGRLAQASGDVGDAVQRTPAVVWLGFSIHGNEASGVEAGIALLYQLAAGQGEGTRRILDSVVVLIDPIENPDGHERHVQDVLRRGGAAGPQTSPFAMVNSGTWPGGRTSHYYFDLNRDWFVLSHPESRARVETFTSWWPQVAVDLHEMGANSTYFFAPPMAPVNKNVPPVILKWWDIFAASNAAAFDQFGWSYFRREGYDEFYPGYGVSWPILTGAIGMTYEEASSAGGAIRRTDGTVLTLHDAAMHHYTAAWATLATTAARRAERLRDYADFRRSAVTEATRSGPRAVVIERDADGRADSLVRRLQQNGVVVQRLRDDAAISGVSYADGKTATARVGRGGYVVDFAQPQGRLARALLEPEAQLDSSFIGEELESRRTGQANRFYDVTGWSLPFAFRVRAWTMATLPGALEPARLDSALTSAPARATYGYAFAPGSEASLRALGSLLADSVHVWFAQRSFRIGAERFPRGAFIARVSANGERVHAAVQRAAASSGARIVALGSALAGEGTDLGSNSVIPIPAPRVALLGGPPVQGNSFGFAWYALDQRLGYPNTELETAAIAAGVLSDFDVLVVPSAGALAGTLGEAGQDRLTRWVRDGGVLVTLGDGTAWLAGERTGLARLRLRRDTTRADSAAGAPLPASVPGAIVRTLVDTLSPLMAGVRDLEIPVLMNSDRIYVAPRDVRAGEVVMRYATEPRLRLSGYLWPEVPSRLAGTPYLWTERVGRGRVIAFAGDPNFRDAWRGLLPLFANAVLLGRAF